MNIFDLVDISERYLELVNPSTPEKMVELGKFLRFREGSRVIDFGCGYAEPLVLWAAYFGIAGIGIDLREQACDRARKKVSERGLADRIEIVCGKGADYKFEEHSFDVATCIGATFVWGGYRQTIQAMKRAIRAGGRLGIGEPYWLRDNVPPGYAEQISPIYSERELLQIAREEGFKAIAKTFDEWIDITGSVLTKLDGDARGGAALSMVEVTGKPIKFVSMGEKLTDLDVFHPERNTDHVRHTQAV